MMGLVCLLEEIPEREICLSPCTRNKERPREHTAITQLSTSQEESSHQELNRLAP